VPGAPHVSPVTLLVGRVPYLRASSSKKHKTTFTQISIGLAYWANGLGV
jgi:hypothetical protein